MEIKKLEKAILIYNKIKDIEGEQSVASEILRMADKMGSSSLSSEITYRLRNDEFTRRLEVEIKRTIEEGLKSLLLSLEAEKQVNERELELL